MSMSDVGYRRYWDRCRCPPMDQNNKCCDILYHLLEYSWKFARLLEIWPLSGPLISVVHWYFLKGLFWVTGPNVGHMSTVALAQAEPVPDLLRHAAETGSCESGEAADRGGAGADFRRLPSVRDGCPLRGHTVPGSWSSVLDLQSKLKINVFHPLSSKDIR